MPRTLTNQSALGAGFGPDIDDLHDALEAMPVLQETGGTLTTDGTEQNLYIRNAPESVFAPRVVFISLDDMVALDDLDVRVYYRIADGGGWLLYDYANYVGADGGLTNSRVMIAVSLFPCRHGVRLTVQQTVGTADLPWSVVEEA